MIDKEEKHHEMKGENLKEILGVVSTEIPALVKSILSSVFSEEAGRNMGKAAAAYYKELKNGGLPEQVAIKMTEDYMRTFTSLGDMLRGVGRGRGSGKEHIGEEIERKIHERLERKREETEEEEDE